MSASRIQVPSYPASGPARTVVSDRDATLTSIQTVAADCRIPMFRDAALRSANGPWAGFVLEESDAILEPAARGYLPSTTLFVCTRGSGTTHWKIRGAYEQNRVEPGTVTIGRSHCELRSVWASNAWSRVAVQLDGAKLRSIAPYDLDTIETSLPPILTTHDSRLIDLILGMRDEVKEGCPSGALFAESISIALLAYLAGRYGDSGELHRTSGLSLVERRSISDYIRANLANDITVRELAALVSMSPSHFSRVFKMSFGASPYQFVMRERIEGAKTMLASTKLTASEVGTALGFASLSHFLKVFRQVTGVSPKQYKARS